MVTRHPPKLSLTLTQTKLVTGLKLTKCSSTIIAIDLSKPSCKVIAHHGYVGGLADSANLNTIDATALHYATGSYLLIISTFSSEFNGFDCQGHLDSSVWVFAVDRATRLWSVRQVVNVCSHSVGTQVSAAFVCPALDCTRWWSECCKCAISVVKLAFYATNNVVGSYKKDHTPPLSVIDRA